MIKKSPKVEFLGILKGRADIEDVYVSSSIIWRRDKKIRQTVLVSLKNPMINVPLEKTSFSTSQKSVLRYRTWLEEFKKGANQNGTH